MASAPIAMLAAVLCALAACVSATVKHSAASDVDPNTLSSSASTSRENAVIVYLVNTANAFKMSNFHRSFGMLHKNFNHRYRYPVFFYYDDPHFNASADMKRVHENAVRSGIELTFQFISDFSVVPGGWSDDNANEFARMQRPAYRNMCRFWFSGFYQRPEIAQFDYYWRFDDDSYILEPIPYDVFRFVRNLVGWCVCVCVCVMI
jgi:hypothetical protein